MVSLKKKITINASSAIGQVAFTALMYFFLYRYLINQLGIEQLGVWSLILSFSSITNLANLGITSGLVKFVAEHVGSEFENKIGALIATSLITLIAVFTPLSVIILLSAKYFLAYIIPSNFLAMALLILPYSIVGLCINAFSGVLTSVFEGYQKNYIRNILYIISGIVMVIVTILLTPVMGLKGVAIGQLIQAIFILASAFIIIYYSKDFSKIKDWHWSTSSFKLLFNYGYKFQVVSVCQLLYEPTTKFLLSKYGGLSLLGHYEMATRLVSQFRSLLVSANQVAIPIIASKNKIDDIISQNEFFSKMNRIMINVTTPLSSLLVILTPVISYLWLGEINDQFIISMFILLIANYINIISGPSYFSCMGEGNLTILVIIHLLMAVLNLILGYSLFMAFGGYGIIVGWAVALIAGSLLLIRAQCKTKNISYWEILNKYDKRLIFLNIVIIIIQIVIYTLGYSLINYHIFSLLLVTNLSANSLFIKRLNSREKFI